MKFGDMTEIAIFLAILGACLFAAFTCVAFSTDDVAAMKAYHSDTRALTPRDSSRLDYAYLGHTGGYLNADQLVLSVSAAQADKRADIRLPGAEPFPARDMSVLNASDMEDSAPYIHKLVVDWFEGFTQSPDYTAVSGRIYEYDSIDNGLNKLRSFAPGRITDEVSGYIFPNPVALSDCRFKLQVVGSDDGSMEYRLFIFLGSLVRGGASGAPIIEYRWFECVLGSNGGVAPKPWLVY